MKRANRHAIAVTAASAPIDSDFAPAVRADWSEWSKEHERKRIAHNIAITQAATDKAIYPREIAETIADDYVKQVPDWRLLRPEIGAAFGRIVKQQPEWQQPEIKRRSDILHMIRENLPRHIRPLVQDLELLLDLVSQAQEASAYLVGYCVGRKAERVYTDAHGRQQVRRSRQAGLGRIHGDGGAR